MTVAQRTKEQAHDYRYFPEPDLPPLLISQEMVAEIASRLPELPAQRRARFAEQYGLGESEAALLTAEREVADFYESVATSDSTDRPRLAANWIVNDLTGLQRARGLPPERLPLTAQQLQDLLDALDAGQLVRTRRQRAVAAARRRRVGPGCRGQTQPAGAWTRKRSFATRCLKRWRPFRPPCVTIVAARPRRSAG